jgi:hypothetical protein
MKVTDEEYRSWLVETLHNLKAWFNYTSGRHLVCPICGVSLYDREDVRLVHTTWHERNNI